MVDFLLKETPLFAEGSVESGLIACPVCREDSVADSSEGITGNVGGSVLCLAAAAADAADDDDDDNNNDDDWCIDGDLGNGSINVTDGDGSGLVPCSMAQRS